MANYPSYTVSLESVPEPESGIEDDVSQPGILHSRIMYGQQYYLFNIIHPNLTQAEFDSLFATYIAGPRATYTYTHYAVSPSVTYSVTFLAPPRIVENHGLARFRVEVRLRGTKD